MGILVMSKGRSNNQNSSGMGFLLVFFPKEQHKHQHQHRSAYSSSTSPSSYPPPSPFKKTHSGCLLSRVQATISICALLVSLTLFFFALSTFDPPYSQALKRLTPPSFWSFPTFSWRAKPKNNSSKHQFKLQGMGTLYRRGTHAMNDLIVAHLVKQL